MNLIQKISKKINPSYKNNKIIIHFIIKVFSIYVLWNLFEWFIGEESKPITERYWPLLSIWWESFCDIIRIMLLKMSALVYIIIGYKPLIYNNYTLYGNGIGTVSIGNYCLGIQLWIFFAALIISYPGKLLGKILFVIIGILCINIINIIRIIIISFVAYYYPEYIQFNHDYVFNGVVYLFVFYMVYIWINKLNK